MRNQQNWRKVDCSKCGAVAGQNCMHPPGDFGGPCVVRRNDADNLLGVKMPNRKRVTKVPLTQSASIT